MTTAHDFPYYDGRGNKLPQRGSTMRTKLYCITDIVAQLIFGGIIHVNNDAVARRAFEEGLRNKESPLSKNPQDYELLWIGEIDTASADITPSPTGPQVISRGIDWLNANKETI